MRGEPWRALRLQLWSRQLGSGFFAAGGVYSLSHEGDRERRGQSLWPWSMNRKASSPRPPNPQFTGLDAERPVGGGDDQSAAGEVLAHQRYKHRLTRSIERGGRLIQQPERPRRCEQPCQRQAAALTGRESGRRQLAGVAESDGGEAIAARAPRHAAEEVGPERKVLSHAERRLERVAVAEIMRLLG